MRTLRYGDDPSQVADLYLPDVVSRPLPVVVLLHGGFWRAVYGRDLTAPLARDLADRGYAAWNVEYRRVGLGGGFRTTTADVAAAIDALADLDAPLDLDRVATVGHSAGGHLAVWAATRHAPRVPLRAVVSLAGVVDLVAGTADGVGAGAIEAFLQGTAPQSASPAHAVPLGVPLLVITGEDDESVPPAMSRTLAERAAVAGDPVQLVELPDTGHMELIDPRHAGWHAVTDRLPELLAPTPA